MISKNHYDVIVIGAGASGMLAAGRASENGASVLMLERNSCPGKKLSITGKGRCNITNSGEIKEFIESYGKNGRFLYRAFSRFFNQDLLAFLNRFGVETKVERGGRVFPVSDDSETVVNALKQYLKKNKVTIQLNSRVDEIIVADNSTVSADKKKQRVTGIRLLNDDEIIYSHKIILATGGLSYPNTGSTGDGYRMAEKLGHNIIPPEPALVPLETKEAFVRDLQGLSLENVTATLFINNKKSASEFGDMLFTHFGISGPIILKLSGLAVEHLIKKECVLISINFKPALSKDQLDSRLLREFSENSRKSLGAVLKNLLPKKLVPVIMSLSNISTEKQCSHITAEERRRLFLLFTDFRLEISKARPIDEAIITRGGITLKEIDPFTMESKIIKGLYFCGEIIDIDGMTGGYNLQAAFSTAYLAGDVVP